MKSATTVLALAAGASAYNSASPRAGTEKLPTSSSTADSRRTFVTRAVVFAGATSLGWLSGGGSDLLHGSGCMCSECSSTTQHGPACTCGSCGAMTSFGLRPPAAMAYEARDVGGKDRSADTAALNLQARETNARLEASGFKLDTREEEQARLGSALSSFSYDSNSSAGKKTAGRGYGQAASNAKQQGTSTGK